MTGGHVYRGRAIPALGGWYLFGDYCSGVLFGIPADAEPPGAGRALPPDVLLETGINITGFGQDADGELYVADLGSGAIYRIVAG